MTTVQWIIISYLGTSTGPQLVFGRLADAHGLKRFYLIGVLIYSLAVLFISLATTFEWVLAWRVLQAIGYAMVVTTVPALVTRLFPAAERGRALGSMMSVGTLGMITATLGGGYLVDAFGWASIFAFRVPLGLIAFFLAYAVLTEAVSDEQQGRLDLGGIVALFVTLVALVLFLNLGGRFGWGSVSVISLAGLVLVAGTWFVRIETRSSEPIIALDVFCGPVNRALIAGFLMSMATFVNLFILPFFVSEVVGASALVLGVLLTLPSIASAAASPIAGLAIRSVCIRSRGGRRIVDHTAGHVRVRWSQRNIERLRRRAAPGSLRHRHGVVPGEQRQQRDGQHCDDTAGDRRRVGLAVHESWHDHQRRHHDRPV